MIVVLLNQIQAKRLLKKLQVHILFWSRPYNRRYYCWRSSYLFFYISQDDTASKAVYSVTTDALAEFLAATFYIYGHDAKEFSLYFKDRIDLWTTADDVQTDSASKVAGSAKDSFIVDNNTVVITDTDKVTTNTYTIGHLTTTDAPDTIVYHYMGQ